jgi:peroxiredoxin
MNVHKFPKISVTFLLVLIIAAAPFFVYYRAQADQTIFNSTADAYIAAGSPNQNHGSDTIMDVFNGRDGLVRFDISSIPAGSTVTAATLTMVVPSVTGANTKNYGVNRILVDWNESTVTWNSPGSTAGTHYATNPTASTLIPGEGTYNFDVTADVASFISGSATNYGWRVKWISNISGTPTQIDVGSRENSTPSNRPTLTVVYTPAGDTTPPAAVTNLALSGPTASTINLTWTAPGDDGSTGTAASYDIRYSTSAITEGNWASATQVTGEPTPQVASSSELMTVSGLSPGTTYFFALKTSDEVPNTSAISNVPSLATAAAVTMSATASVDTHWVKGGTNGQNFVFTVSNSATSSQAIQWVKIERPSARYTLSAGSASGWSASVGGTIITFTGGSIAAGSSGVFTVTADIASGDETQIAWAVNVDDDSAGVSPTAATASSGGALNSGIDSTAPTNVAVSSVTVNSAAKLTANATTSVDSASGLHSSPYWFDETTGGPGASDSTAWQSGLSFEDTGLAAATQYCYQVKARDAVGNESAFSTSQCGTTASSTDTTAPAAVSNLSVSSVSGSSVTLAWTAPGDDGNTGTATSYDVRYSNSTISDSNWASSTQAAGEPMPSSAGSSESFTVSGLASSTTYFFALKTSDEVPNVSGLSNVVSTTTTSGADITPPVISGTSAANITQSSAVILWDTNEAADSQVEYGVTLSYGSQSTLNTNLVTSHSVTLSGLSAGTTYNYRIKSRDAAGNMATSDNLIFSSAAALGGIPGAISVSRISEVSVATTTETTATITWKTDQQSTSRVDYGLVDSQSTAVGTMDTKLVYEHTVTVSGLEPDTHYRFQVYSENSEKHGTFSTYYEFTTKKPKPKPPPVMSDIKVVSVRPTSAKITWKTNIPSTSQIRFGTKTGELNQVTIELATLVTEHSVTISDLSPKTTYFFKAISRSAEEITGESEEKTLTTESLEIQTVVEVKKPEALAPGSPGTQVPKIAVGETVTLVPVLATPKDVNSPEVTLFRFRENPTQNTSPAIEGSARDREGVIVGISYSTDGGDSWHPISEVSGIGSSAARFSAKIPNLREGNYQILFRIRDNSGNIGKSETRTLVIDIEPPVTGANVLLLGTQSVFPSALGTITTLTGIAERIVTSAIGGVVNVDIIAKRADAKRYTYEEKRDEKPAQLSGEFPTAKVALAATTGQIKDQEVSTSSQKNDVTQGKESDSELALQNFSEKNLGGLAFPLNYSKAADLWFGDIFFAEAGEYQLQIKAVDGAGRISLRSINPITVVEPGRVVSAKTGEALAGAKVSVFQFSPEINDFILWPGEVFNQANPQFTGQDGSFRFIVPPGKYYLKVEKAGYRTFYTDIEEFAAHTAINLRLSLLPDSKLRLPFSIFGLKEISLSIFPDFWGMSRVKETLQAAVAPPEAVKVLLDKPAPVFALPDSSNNIVDIRYLRGKKTILTTWATWAPLAQVQLPILDKLQQENAQDVRVLLLSLQESQGVVKSYIERGGYQLESVIDKDGQLTELYPIFTMPQHFFLDRKGIVRDVFVGFLNDKELQEKLEKL